MPSRILSAPTAGRAETNNAKAAKRAIVCRKTDAPFLTLNPGATLTPKQRISERKSGSFLKKRTKKLLSFGACAPAGAITPAP
jgi:hypothetical protein